VLDAGDLIVYLIVGGVCAGIWLYLNHQKTKVLFQRNLR